MRATLAAWAAEVVGGVPGVRPLRPQSLHLTLCFLGEIELEQVPALAARLQAGGWYAPEGRPWLPHITLARAGRAGGAGRAGRPAGAGGAAGSATGSVQGSDLRAPVSAGSVQESALRALASAGLPPVELHPFTPEAVALLRSWPGSRYEPLARTAL